MLNAAYHPATNEQAERYVQTIKRGLKALSTEQGTLQEKLNQFLMQYRKISHDTTRESPASLFLKRNIQTKIDSVIPNIMDIIPNKQNSRKSKIKQFREFYLNQKAAVRNYTPEAEWKTGKIIARLGKLHYKIKVG